MTERFHSTDVVTTVVWRLIVLALFTVAFNAMWEVGVIEGEAAESLAGVLTFALAFVLADGFRAAAGRFQYYGRETLAYATGGIGIVFVTAYLLLESSAPVQVRGTLAVALSGLIALRAFEKPFEAAVANAVERIWGNESSGEAS